MPSRAFTVRYYSYVGRKKKNMNMFNSFRHCRKDEISFDIVAENGNNVEATFDTVERIVQLVAFNDVASTLLLVWTGLKKRNYGLSAKRRAMLCRPLLVTKRVHVGIMFTINIVVLVSYSVTLTGTSKTLHRADPRCWRYYRQSPYRLRDDCS